MLLSIFVPDGYEERVTQYALEGLNIFLRYDEEAKVNQTIQTAVDTKVAEFAATNEAGASLVVDSANAQPVDLNQPITNP